MTDALRIDFAFPGDINLPTGGYGYDRRVMHELEKLGHTVRPIALPASFPHPDDNDLAVAARLLGDKSRDALIVDGLAYSVLPPSILQTLAPAPMALVHHPLFLETGLDAAQATRFRASEQAALDRASAVITTSRMTADIVAREFGIPEDLLFAAEPGVDPAPRAAGSKDETVRLVAVGSLIPRKGYDDLVAALVGLVGDWRLSIIGATDLAPDYAKGLIARVSALGLSDRVVFVGKLTADEVAAAYAASDVFVTSSHFEGYGMAIAEAVARGLPIVLTEESAAAGAAPPGATLTYPAGDVEALRRALTSAISNRGVRQELAANAWAAACKQPRWGDSARMIVEAVRYSLRRLA